VHLRVKPNQGIDAEHLCTQVPWTVLQVKCCGHSGFDGLDKTNATLAIVVQRQTVSHALGKQMANHMNTRNQFGWSTLRMDLCD
jgi:hypothetical protein